MHHCHLSHVSSYCSMAICILLTLLAVLPAPLLASSRDPSTSTGSPGLPQNADQLNQTQDIGPTAAEKDFLQQIFNKYGHQGVMTFEGFEHLLESLGLGGIAFTDHDINSHKVKNVSFLKFHDKNHTHKTVDSKNIVQASRSGADGNKQDDHSHTYGHNTKDRTSDSGRREDSTGESEKVAQIEDDTHNRSLPYSAPAEINTKVYIAGLQDDHKYPILSSVRTEPELRKCLSAKDLFAFADLDSFDSVLSPKNFMQLCPVLVYELDQRHCSKGPKTPELDSDAHSAIDNKATLNTDSDGSAAAHTNHWSESDDKSQGIPATVWLYSTAAVIIISLCGLLSVIMIPIVQKLFYQQLIQFLVALAVGSLTGDAFLHLIPHAMSAMVGGGHEHNGTAHDHESSGSDHHNHDHHSGPVWIGLTAWSGVCIFFLAERILVAISGHRQRKLLQPASHVRMLRKDNQELSSAVGEKLCLNESEMKKMHRSSGCFDNKELENGYMPVRNGDRPGNNCVHAPFLDESIPVSTSCDKSGIVLLGEKCDIDEMDEVSVSIERGHSHGHHHHHSHTVPGNVSNVAWMVILGDGMHNFSDGLAIGAAFADGITGGLSTAIAVFCHELPHELGDFAMLLKAGMSIRQAIYYNGLSSVLCFLGMIIGVLLGNLGTVTPWIFAATAGTFVYIALVDMLPELSVEVTSLDYRVFVRLLIQAVGLAMGCGIMLAIALYEPELLTMLQ